ncbi:hypothetical protein TCAL_00119 [Tigriopus californicus]|uniref:G-protein coupled receptors family 1 profile domain-containing protein n=1 Tax=Tigriopus californicus TaxID=6832 RepID=A0A553PFX8_TIGCA|nr:cephalotocin receptor 1-like [Tigriopus californicus]TRY76586.1 hypothetical protein TCAL_00119 [Tigriopus californicus]
MLEIGSKFKSWFLALFIIAIVLSNLFSVIAIFRRRPKITRMYFFLLHLSLADMLNAFLTLLPEFVRSLALDTNLGDVGCKVIKYLQMFAPYLSSYILVMTAVDRYQTICFPLENRFWIPRDSFKKIAGAWFLSGVLCIPQIFIHASKLEGGVLQCKSFLRDRPNAWVSEIYVTWFAVTSFFIPVMALSFFYVRICGAIRQNLNSKQKVNLITLTTASIEMVTKPRPWYRTSFRRTSPVFSETDNMSRKKFASCSDLRPRTHSVEGITRAKIKSVKQTIIIILGYILCSSPGVIYQLGVVWLKDNHTLARSTEWFFWLMSFNSLLNPWLYIALNRDLQVAIKNFLLCQDPPSLWISHSHTRSWQNVHDFYSPSGKIRPRSNTTDVDALSERPQLGCSFRVHWSPSLSSTTTSNLKMMRIESLQRRVTKEAITNDSDQPQGLEPSTNEHIMRSLSSYSSSSKS